MIDKEISFMTIQAFRDAVTAVKEDYKYSHYTAPELVLLDRLEHRLQRILDKIGKEPPHA